jgi:hypothetical protein
MQRSAAELRCEFMIKIQNLIAQEYIEFTHTCFKFQQASRLLPGHFIVYEKCLYEQSKLAMPRRLAVTTQSKHWKSITKL